MSDQNEEHGEGNRWNTQICVKNLTDKQNLEVEVQTLQEEIDQLNVELKEAQKLKVSGGFIQVKQSDYEKLQKELDTVNSQLIETVQEIGNKEQEVEELKGKSKT